jgi:hypothetical protein
MPDQPHTLTTMNYFEMAYWFISLCILVATVYYIATGPLNAVKTGRQLNNDQQKDNAKRNLFLTLFALRGSPVHYDFVRGLNQIDVVFEDTPSVLDAWHTHYDSLQIKGQVNENQIWDLQRTNLLSAMAVSLGYNRIRQTDMLQNYYPEGHSNQFREDWELRFAAKEYLKKGGDLYEILIANANKQTDEGQEPQS